MNIGPYRIDERDWITQKVGMEIYTHIKNETDYEKLSGVKLPKNPTFLAKGTQGSVFDIGGGKVIKITEDKSEAKIASRLIGKKLRGIYTVHHVAVNTDMANKPVYFIIQDKLKPVSEGEYEKISNYFYDFKNDIMNNDYDFWDKYLRGSPDISTWWDDIVLKAFIEIYVKENKPPKGAVDIAYGLNNLNKKKISYYDLHSGNVMKSGSEFVIIDLGYSKSLGGPGKIAKVNLE